jgi:hypothetical protein
VAKLEKVFIRASNYGEFEGDDNRLSTKVVSRNPKSRFEAMSASIWRTMQQQLRQSSKGQRLKPMLGQHDLVSEDGNNDQNLFDENALNYTEDDIMLNDEEAEEEEGHNWFNDGSELFDELKEKHCHESDDDFLFQNTREHTWFEEHDLFQQRGAIAVEEGAFGGY